MMDPALQSQLVWWFLGGVSVAVAWIGKTIVKPWSDAYLVEKQANADAVKKKSELDEKKNVAEIDHLKNVDAALVSMVGDIKKQTPILESIDTRLESVNAQGKVTNATLSKMDSDNQRLCKGTACPITPDVMQQIIAQLTELKDQGSSAAAELLAKAKESQARGTALSKEEEEMVMKVRQRKLDREAANTTEMPNAATLEKERDKK